MRCKLFTQSRLEFKNEIKLATIEKFEDLEVWQLSRCLCQRIEDIISSEKLNRRYAIKDQIERSSGSIMDNIAEGFGRSGSLV
ncbi:MAG: four helix bundle protein [Bacteroidota bacterium]|nr:four helix bundle protein [Bacteroidota bacterium]